MRFHSAEDREREERIAQRIGDALNVEMYRMPERSPVDYLAASRASGHVVGVWEVKCRRCSPTTYDSLIVNAHKLINLDRWAQLLGVPAHVGAGYNDGSAWVAAMDDVPQPYAVRTGGIGDRPEHTARGRTADLVAHLPHDVFRRLP